MFKVTAGSSLVIEGIIIVILAITGFRSAVFYAIPASMKAAIGVPTPYPMKR